MVEGEVCGRSITIRLADINDRGAFTAKCTYDPLTGTATVELSTTERGSSDAILAMSETTARLADTLAGLIGTAAGAAAGIPRAAPRSLPQPRPQSTPVTILPRPFLLDAQEVAF
jgi:hypothetical protein